MVLQLDTLGKTMKIIVLMDENMFAVGIEKGGGDADRVTNQSPYTTNHVVTSGKKSIT